MKPLIFAFLLVGTSVLSAQDGGIEIFAGETLFEDGWRVSLSGLYRQDRGLRRGSDEVEDPLHTSFQEMRTILGIDYGFRADVTFSALLPYVDKRLETELGTVSSHGFGDASLIAKYRLLHDLWHAGGMAGALVGGVETPTGATHEMQGGVRLPPGMQPGRGAWNPFLAGSFTYEQGKARFDTTLFYKFNTEGAEDFEQGDFLSFRLSAGYRVIMTRYPGPTLGVGLGLQYRHEGRATWMGQTVTNSGSDLLQIIPALSYHPIPRVDVSLGVSLPIWEDYNGTQLAREYRLWLKLGLRF